MRQLLPLLLSLTLLSSCSSTSAPELSATDLARPIDSVELFVSRSSVGNIEFEQIKLSGDSLYAECGKIRAGRFYPESQGLEPLPASDRAAVEREAQTLLALLKDYERSFEEPGDNNAIYDPGQLYVTVLSRGQKTEVKTNLDSVAEPDTIGEKHVERLASVMRGAAGSSLCSNRTFYGLQATNP